MARIRYTRSRPPPHQGRRWPSTLQQVQIERVAKNSKPRNGFDFSYTPRATTTPNPNSPKPPLGRNCATGGSYNIQCGNVPDTRIHH